MDAAGRGPSQNRRPLIRECKEDVVGRSFGVGGFAKRPSDAETKQIFQELGRGDSVGRGNDEQQHQQGLRTLPLKNMPPQQNELQFLQQQQQVSHFGTGLNPQTQTVQSGAVNAADYRDLASHLSNTPGDGLATVPAYAPEGGRGGGVFGTMGQNFMTGTAFGSATAWARGSTPETEICQGGMGGGERESGIFKAFSYGQGQASTCGRMDADVNFGQAHGWIGGNMMGIGSSNSGNMAVAGSCGFGGNMLGTGGGDMGTTGGEVGATGLLRGNDLLQPSPVINRKHHQQGQQQQQQAHQPQEYSPPQISNPLPSHSVEEYQVAATMMHQQQQCLQLTQQRHCMERKLKQVKEEGMPMRQYESRTDQSPMSAEKGEDKRVAQPSMKMVSMSNDAPGKLFGDSPCGQEMIQDRSGESPSSGQLQQHSRSEQMQQNQDQTAQDSSSIVSLLQEYPFSFGNFAAWVCPHCQHVPPHYRGGNYMWQASTPPPRQVVESHLRFCPGLNPENMSVEANQHLQQHQQYQQGAQQSPCLGMQGQTVMQQQVQQAQNPFILQPQQQQMQQAQNPFILQPQQQLSQQGSSGLPNEMVKKEQGAPDPPGMTIPQPSWSSTMQDQRGAIIGQGRFQGSIVPSVESLPAQQSEGVTWDVSGGAGGSYPIKSNQPFPYHLHQPLSSFSGALSQYPHQMYPQVAGGTLALPPSTVSSNKSGRKRARTKISPKGHQTDDATYKAAVDFLTDKTIEMARPVAESLRSDVGQSLVDRSDANLLTDYFFHMMQQLVVCRFSEKDRKTRGGKRKDINIGYGGLQCIHCIEAPSSRKFFWSTVDRLANSFAEIPCHILNCPHCPDDAKEALLALKGRHPDQMQMLPRGSQKVFFRRMWRRLHDGDSEAGERMVTSAGERQTSSTSGGGKGREPSPSEPRPRPSAAAAEALKSPYIATPTGAEALAKPMEPEDEGSQEGEMVPEERERVLLAIPEDKDWLSDTDCFVRNNIEVFSSTQSDVTNAAAERKRMYTIKVGQVGIRCVHCAKATDKVRGTDVSYPHSISGICESVKEFQRVHLDNCHNVPQDLRNASHKLGSGTASLKSVLNNYYVQAARALGLFDTQDSGVRAGGEPVPMSMAGFQTPGGEGNGGASPFASAVESSVLTPTTTTELANPKEPPGSDASTIVAEMSLKRKASSMDGQPLNVNPWLPTPGALGASQSEPSPEPETKRAKSKIDAPGKNESANKMNAIDMADTRERIRPQYPCTERRCHGGFPRGRCISLSPPASKMHPGDV